MTDSSNSSYDVAIVGAGPVGSLCALAHARKGARVALLEANPKAAGRLAGEWLHPPAVRMLQENGVSLDACPHSSQGNGFVVFPDDRSEPIVLPYSSGAMGMTCEHSELVATLHQAMEDDSQVRFYRGARVQNIENGRITYSINGTQNSLATDRVIGADGRSSIVRKSLGLPSERLTCSRMIGVVAEGIDLPHEGYGHVILGGPGPILIFRLGDETVRIIVDVPLDHWTPRDRVAMLTESYAYLLPESVREAFVRALEAGEFQAAGNELQLRATYGTSHRVLIGDAAGHYHPLTAIGLTLGFSDALTLAAQPDFRVFAAKRIEAVRMPERLALCLYETFADYRPEIVAIRQATYRRWRSSSKVRGQTMKLLACEDMSLTRLGLTSFRIVLRAITSTLPRSLNSDAWRRAREVSKALLSRVGHLLVAIRNLRLTSKAPLDKNTRLWTSWSRSLLTSVQPQKRESRTTNNIDATTPSSTRDSMRRATDRLVDMQRADGSWEGEMVWCPMLTAQYVILSFILDEKLDPRRRLLVLRQFEHTRLPDGLWGLHEHSHPYLFVTTLVYVAARLLGVDKDDPLIAKAGQFLQTEDILGIPSWGKFWLALLNLYDWKGLNPVLPEMWRLPSGIPLHPSNWYCHTRLIYMAMSVVYSSRFQAPVTPLITALRRELFGDDFDRVKFARGRTRLRKEDVFQRPTIRLRFGFLLGRFFEKIHGKSFRAKCVQKLVEQIRWELQNSDHTSISPVSGFLNILALWLQDPEDENCRKALARIEGWIWEDDAEGTRITGARSASWDTGFALQALSELPESVEVKNAVDLGTDFLASQQIRKSFDGFEAAYRSDPKGGWCFAGRWHGWPVSDCTAEAVLGLLETRPNALKDEALQESIEFMLRSQNKDGGFGSYEARRSTFGLEWLNPAEMFGESMTEKSFVECTASCMAALALGKQQLPNDVSEKAQLAISRGESWLRKSQRSDGSWRGVWGVQFIYGTLFGIKGLRAAGSDPSDPSIRLACRWLLDRQREDGGWGEHYSGCVKGCYVPHNESQVIQTAWALIALLKAGESNWSAISRGIKFLVDNQQEDGTWKRQDMVGVFFRTALLDYELYRHYFPLHALSLYEQRRTTRRNVPATSEGISEVTRVEATSPSAGIRTDGASVAPTPVFAREPENLE